jgi:flagellar biosynthesis chaperone FliJ
MQTKKTLAPTNGTNKKLTTSTSTSSSSPSSYFTTTILSHLAVAIISFQLGSVSNFTHYSTITPDHGSSSYKDVFQGSNNNNNNECKCPDISEEQRLRLLNNPDGIKIIEENGNVNPNDDAADGDENFDTTNGISWLTNATVDTTLATSINNLFVGSSLVSRDSFITNFDIGVPWDMNHYYKSDVLMLYSDPLAFPTKTTTRTTIKKGQSAKDSSSSSSRSKLFPNVHYTSASDATENCDSLKVILLNKELGQCVAIVPQWESYLVHKYLRFKDERLKFNRKLPLISKNYPLRYVSRFHSEKKGGAERDARIPTMSQLQRYLPMLTDYITNLENVLDTLRPILVEMMIRYKKLNGLDELQVSDQRRKRGQRKKRVRDKYAVVVMVCNYGQSELFLNFICTAKSRGLDISRILLFATDNDMYNLAKSIPDISVFNVGNAFGGESVIPKTAAKVYGDKVFTGMMFSKIYCVHLINYLGYDVLFQDVDIVWYKNPIDYFENSAISGNYDFYFQDGMFHYIIFISVLQASLLLLS